MATIRSLIKRASSLTFSSLAPFSHSAAALAAKSDEKKVCNAFAMAALKLNLVDPAMGSGHFLVRAVDVGAGGVGGGGAAG